MHCRRRLFSSLKAVQFSTEEIVMIRYGTFLLCCWTIGAVVEVQAAQGSAEENSGGRLWAVLIGVESYEKASPLRFTINDVLQISQTLSQRGGARSQDIVTFTDNAPRANRKPLRDVLMAELPRWLAKPHASDRILVYFSGHGFRDDSGRLYLATQDCDPLRAAETGIPVSWLRDRIAECDASFKMLVLDACHAGSEKGATDNSGVAARELGEPFRDLEGVVTLASSKADEKSLLWDEKSQSLFSYWLNQGLKGHADSNGDAEVDIDELNRYVHRHVTRTARRRFQRSQTPVRIVRSGTPGVPTVLRLTPLTLKQLLLDIAHQMAWV